MYYPIASLDNASVIVAELACVDRTKNKAYILRHADSDKSGDSPADLSRSVRNPRL